MQKRKTKTVFNLNPYPHENDLSSNSYLFRKHLFYIPTNYQEMNTKVRVSFDFNIPTDEIAEVDKSDLVEWILFTLGVKGEIDMTNQFNRYDMQDFRPKINEIDINGITKKYRSDQP